MLQSSFRPLRFPVNKCFPASLTHAQTLPLAVAFTPLSNIAPFERLGIIGQPQNIILRNIRATIVLGGSQLTRCIPLSKREAKTKNQAGFFCVRQVYFTSKSRRRICWRVNQPLKHIFSHPVSGKQYYEALFLSYRPRTEFVLFLPYSIFAL